MMPEVRFAKSGDVHITYQVLGDGSVDLVWIHDWLSDLELQWEEPAYSRLLESMVRVRPGRCVLTSSLAKPPDPVIALNRSRHLHCHTMPETWLSRCERYVEARTSGNESRWRELEADLQRDFAHGQLSESDVDWLTGALTDSDAALREEVKWFVEFVLRISPPLVAAPLFDPLIKAAVYERDPSHNRYFVEPCVRSTGWQRTAQALLVYVRDGTDLEKAGAVNALYWAFGHSRSHSHYLTDRVPDPAESEGESPSATGARAHRVLLEEFVRNPDVDVRRGIVPWLRDANDYPSDLRGLAQEARRIALSHPDEYIHARAEITWGITTGKRSSSLHFLTARHLRRNSSDRRTSRNVWAGVFLVDLSPPRLPGSPSGEDSRWRPDPEEGLVLAVGLPQHADEHRSECPVFLAVDQELGEGAGLRSAAVGSGAGGQRDRRRIAMYEAEISSASSDLWPS